MFADVQEIIALKLPSASEFLELQWSQCILHSSLFFAPDLWRPQTFVETCQTVASHFALEKLRLESAASKNPRMHTGIQRRAYGGRESKLPGQMFAKYALIASKYAGEICCKDKVKRNYNTLFGGNSQLNKSRL